MEPVLFVSKSTSDKGMYIRSSIVIATGFVFLWLFPFINKHNVDLLCIIGLLIVLPAYIVGFFYVPYRFILTETQLIVKRHCGDLVLPLEEIMEIRLFSYGDKKGLFGCGAGGIFMNYGLYRTHTHKRLHVYTRRDSNLILLVTPKKKYVFAPNDILLVEMVQKLKQKKEYGK